jgi:hypothetical protein
MPVAVDNTGKRRRPEVEISSWGSGSIRWVGSRRSVRNGPWLGNSERAVSVTQPQSEAVELLAVRGGRHVLPKGSDQ